MRRYRRSFPILPLVLLTLAPLTVNAQAHMTGKPVILDDSDLSREFSRTDWIEVVKALSQALLAIEKLPDIWHNAWCHWREEDTIRNRAKANESLKDFQLAFGRYAQSKFTLIADLRRFLGSKDKSDWIDVRHDVREFRAQSDSVLRAIDHLPAVLFEDSASVTRMAATGAGVAERIATTMAAMRQRDGDRFAYEDLYQLLELLTASPASDQATRMAIAQFQRYQDQPQQICGK